LDKTGTLTEGVFKIQNIIVAPGFDQKDFIQGVGALESKSTHPIAKAILEFAGDSAKNNSVDSIEEFPGEGLKGIVNRKEILAGNEKLMSRLGIPFPDSLKQIVDTLVIVAIDKKYAGYLTIADQLKPEAKDT